MSQDVMRIGRGISGPWSFGGRLKTKFLLDKAGEKNSVGKGKDISVIKGMKSISTRKTLVSETMKENKSKRKVSGSYLRKQEILWLLSDFYLTDKFRF